MVTPIISTRETLRARSADAVRRMRTTDQPSDTGIRYLSTPPQRSRSWLGTSSEVERLVLIDGRPGARRSLQGRIHSAPRPPTTPIELTPYGYHRYLGYVFSYRALRRSITAATRSLRWPAREPARLRVDIALLPINGTSVRSPATSPAARPRSSRRISAPSRHPLPLRHVRVQHRRPADEFIPECERLGQPYRVLQLGERFSSTEIPRMKRSGRSPASTSTTCTWATSCAWRSTTRTPRSSASATNSPSGWPRAVENFRHPDRARLHRLPRLPRADPARSGHPLPGHRRAMANGSRRSPRSACTSWSKSPSPPRSPRPTA